MQVVCCLVLAVLGKTVLGGGKVAYLSKALGKFVSRFVLGSVAGCMRLGS